MTELRELAPAKVNLSLHVGPPKQNGRHDLMSLVTFAGMEAADVLTAEPASTFCLAVEGPFARDSGPAKDNLVLQAARMLDEALDGNAPTEEPSLRRGYWRRISGCRGSVTPDDSRPWR